MPHRPCSGRLPLTLRRCPPALQFPHARGGPMTDRGQVKGPEGSGGLQSHVYPPWPPLPPHPSWRRGQRHQLPEQEAGKSTRPLAGVRQRESKTGRRKGCTGFVTRQRGVRSPHPAKYQPCGPEQGTCSPWDSVSSAVKWGQDAPAQGQQVPPSLLLESSRENQPLPPTSTGLLCLADGPADRRSV